jgi:hypothetical protein
MSTSYLKQTQDVTELTLKLMKSTSVFVSKRLASLDAQESYTKAINLCFPIGREQMDELIARIHRNEALGRLIYPKTIFNSNQEKLNGHCMACAHALDIAISMRRRFITGDSLPDNIINGETGDSFYED